MFNHEAYEAMESAATWVEYFQSYPRCGHTVIVQGAAVEVGSGKVAWRVSTAEAGEYLATTEPRGCGQSARTYQNWLGLPLGATVVTRCPRSFIVWRASYTLM